VKNKRRTVAMLGLDPVHSRTRRRFLVAGAAAVLTGCGLVTRPTVEEPEELEEPDESMRSRLVSLIQGVLESDPNEDVLESERVEEPREPVRSMLEFRREAVVVQEYDLSCGAAALATILRYQHGDEVTERELVDDLIRRDVYIENPEVVKLRQGFSLLDLKRVAEARGYKGIGYGNLTLEDALELAPVITPINPKGYNHFVVLVGRVGDRVQVADPAFGNATMTVERFEKYWMDLPGLGHVGFIVTTRRRRKKPAPPGRLVPNPRVFLTPPIEMVRQPLA
jgi:uncharacterized protein